VRCASMAEPRLLAMFRVPVQGRGAQRSVHCKGCPARPRGQAVAAKDDAGLLPPACGPMLLHGSVAAEVAPQAYRADEACAAVLVADMLLDVLGAPQLSSSPSRGNTSEAHLSTAGTAFAFPRTAPRYSMFLVVVVVDRTGLRGEGVAARTDKQGLAALIVSDKRVSAGPRRHQKDNART
jgi:hypothetical protein